MGGFRFLDSDEVHTALVDLSHAPGQPWEDHLMDEVDRAFGQFRKYLSGQTPNPKCYGDVRQKCIDAVRLAKEVLDRRLWTWEARSFAEIRIGDVDAVALAPEAWKELRDRFDGDLPLGIQYLIGHVAETGAHYFSEEQVVAAFAGEPT